jgi:hypothetical protein
MPDSNIAAAAAAINALQAHAAVHLDGHNGDSFIAAFALHPAPLQVLSHGNRDHLQSTLAAATSHADIAACSPPLQLHYRFISTAAAAFLPLYVTDAVVAPVEYVPPLMRVHTQAVACIVVAE